MKEIDEEKWNRVLNITDMLMDGKTNTLEVITMLQSITLLVLLKAIDSEKDEIKRKELIEGLKKYLNKKVDEVYKEVVEYFNK